MSTVTRERRRGTRLLSRALLVLGGAVAGTAAAWVISSASAQADTLAPVNPAVPAGQVTQVTMVTQALTKSVGVTHSTPLGPSATTPASPPVSGAAQVAAGLDGSAVSFAAQDAAGLDGSAVRLPAVLPAVLPTALPTSLPTALPAALPAALPGELPASLPVSAVRSASGLAAVTDRLRAAVAEFDALGTGNPPAGQFRAPAGNHGGAPVPAPAVAGALFTARNAPAGQAAGAAGTVHTLAAHAGPTGAPMALATDGVGSGGPVPAGSGSGQYTPALVPSGAGTAGSSGSSGPGGSVLGPQFTQPGVPGLFPLGGTAQGIPFGAAPTGKQPGVTPD